ncbi:MAG: hypothetical protein Q4C96_08015 [Planctomycetia bacterium]|nr:hypothetical protein [Planctomycetia bacterium]
MKTFFNRLFRFIFLMSIIFSGSTLWTQENSPVIHNSAPQNVGDQTPENVNTPIQNADTAPKVNDPEPVLSADISEQESPVTENPSSEKNIRAKVITLPSIFSHTSHFAQAPWGDTILLCPNDGAKAQRAKDAHLPVFLRIKDHEYFLWGMCPLDPVSGMANPVFAQFGPDGNMYVCDNPHPSSEGKRPGRIIRVFVNDVHRPYNAEIVAYGLQNPRALAIFNDDIYVLNQISASEDGKPVQQIYKFPLDLADQEVKNLPSDEFMISRFVFPDTETPTADKLFIFKSEQILLGYSQTGFLEEVIPAKEDRPETRAAYIPREKCIPFSCLTHDVQGNLYLLDVNNNITCVDKEKNILTLQKDVLPLTKTTEENHLHYGILLHKTGLMVTVSGSEIPAQIIFLPAVSVTPEQIPSSDVKK